MDPAPLRLPAGFPDEVIEAMASEPKICKYLDIPFQHISDAQLASMHRRHTKAEAMELIGQLRGAIPDLALRTTLLVGYPARRRPISKNCWRSCARCVSNGWASSPTRRRREPGQPKPPRRHSRDDQAATRGARHGLQNEIRLENNRRRVGRTERVIIDSRQGDWYVGRTQYDSPEVDQEILIPPRNAACCAGTSTT